MKRILNSAIRNYALLFFGGLLFHLAGTWIVPLIDRDEPRFAEASREMIERGDYVVPYFNNEYRFDKPPLTYWMQVAAYKIFGENDFAARFPSAVAAALTAMSIFAWGRRIGGERVGWWAAIIFSLALQTVVHAKAAVADMWLVLFVTLAHWAGYELIFGQRERSTPNPPSPSYGVASAQRPTLNYRWWIFYLALAFGFLAKGPIGWMPLLTVTSTIIFLREPALFRRFAFGRGMLLTLVIVSLWGVPALIRTHGEFFWVGIGRHVIGRSVSAIGGHGARSLGLYVLLLPFYFVTILVSFFPWSLKLPWLVKQIRADRDKIDIYLLSGIAITFGIFTFVATKLPHYILPAFPLLTLLLVRRWFASEMPTAFLKRTASITGAAYLLLALIVAPFTISFFPSRDLFLQAREDLRPEMKFGAIGYNEPSLVWYFRQQVRGFLQTQGLRPSNVQPFMEQMGPRFIILPTELAATIYPELPNTWKKFSSRGFNLVKGKRADLTLILKPE